MAFKLTHPTPSEADIQGEIIEYLRHHPDVVWVRRLNGGGAHLTGGRWVWFYRLFIRGRVPLDGRGSPDLEAMLQGGRYVALEVKRARKRGATPEQTVFLDAVREGGGLSAVVESCEQVIFLLGAARSICGRK